MQGPGQTVLGVSEEKPAKELLGDGVPRQGGRYYEDLLSFEESSFTDRNPWRVRGLTSFKMIILAALWETQGRGWEIQGRVRREGKGKELSPEQKLSLRSQLEEAVPELLLLSGSQTSGSSY